MSLIVSPYAGQSQPQQIEVPDWISYQEIWEESCWSMPPYATFYPPPPEPEPTKLTHQPIFGKTAWQALHNVHDADAADQ
jgi:hypothetical protein